MATPVNKCKIIKSVISENLGLRFKNRPTGRACYLMKSLP